MSDDTGFGSQDGDELVSLDAGADEATERDRDGAASLRDTQEESGDEEEVTDTYDLDEREAREAGVWFDGGTGDEPRLD